MKATFSSSVWRRRSFVVVGALLAFFPPALKGASGSSFSVEQVADLGPRPGIPVGALPRGAVRVGDRVLFFASDEVSPVELWTTDGTQAGTRRVRDVSASGSDSSILSAFGLVAARGRAYFQTLDPLAGLRLWRTDGSREGTVPIFSVGLYEDLEQALPPEIVTAALGGDLLFLRPNREGFLELWRTGASSASARRLASLPAASGADSAAVRLLSATGRAYFTFQAPSSSRTEIWTTDGTAAGTVRLTSIPRPASPIPSQPIVVGGRLFFLGFDAPHGFELWTSDGSTAGTRLVRDFASGRRPALYEQFVAGRQVLYFTLETSAGREVWRSDGTQSGTVRLPTIDGSFAIPAAELNGSLLFFQSGAFWRARKSASPVRLAPFLDPCGPAVPSEGKLHFFADDGARGCKLWRSDGTPEGTEPSVNSLPEPSAATLFALGRRLIFFAPTAPEVGVIEGDRVAPLRGVRVEVRSGRPTSLVPWAEGLAFAATGESRRAIYRSDGSPEGTMSIASGARWSPLFTELPRDLVPLGETLVFRSPDGIEASKFSLPGANPVRLDRFPAGVSLNGQALFSFGGRALWLTLSEDGRDVVLRSTDGTPTGTATVSHLFAAPEFPIDGSTYVPEFSVVSTAHHLAFYFSVVRNEIWTTDGTAAGTRKAFDLDEADDEAAPRWLLAGVPFGDGMLFATWGAQPGIQFWRTDASEAGASPVDRLTDVSLPRRLTPVGGHVFFTTAGPGGVELWVTDGSPFGAHRVRDIRPGPGGSFPRDLTAVGDRLFFTADDGTSGRELWESDGTAAGTARVADLVPGPEGSFPQRLSAVSFDGAPLILLFAANDGVHGLEPWIGEANGVRLLADVAPGSASSSPAEFLAVGSRLYFAATTRSAGRELWRGTLENP